MNCTVIIVSHFNWPGKTLQLTTQSVHYDLSSAQSLLFVILTGLDKHSSFAQETVQYEPSSVQSLLFVILTDLDKHSSFAQETVQYEPSSVLLLLLVIFIGLDKHSSLLWHWYNMNCQVYCHYCLSF